MKLTWPYSCLHCCHSSDIYASNSNYNCRCYYIFFFFSNISLISSNHYNCVQHLLHHSNVRKDGCESAWVHWWVRTEVTGLVSTAGSGSWAETHLGSWDRLTWTALSCFSSTNDSFTEKSEKNCSLKKKKTFYKICEPILLEAEN